MIRHILKSSLGIVILMIATIIYGNSSATESKLIISGNEMKQHIELEESTVNVEFIAPKETTKISYTINGISMGGISGDKGKFELDFNNTIGDKVQVMFFAYMLTVNKTYLYEFDIQRSLINYPITKSPRIKTTYKKEIKPVYEDGYIPILMYHSIQKGEVTNPSFEVSAKNFEMQIMTLIQNGYAPICFKDYERYNRGEAGLPVKPFIIALDDGCLDNYTVAYPILKKMMAQATYFINPAYMGRKIYAYPHFTWDNAREMEASGLIDIQSHTYSHTDMSVASEERIKEEIDTSFKLIEENLGVRDIKVLCYPQYRSSLESRTIAKELGITFQITNLVTKYNREYDATQLRRIHVKDTTTPEELINSMIWFTR